MEGWQEKVIKSKIEKLIDEFKEMQRDRVERIYCAVRSWNGRTYNGAIVSYSSSSSSSPAVFIIKIPSSFTYID